MINMSVNEVHVNFLKCLIFTTFSSQYLFMLEGFVETFNIHDKHICANIVIMLIYFIIVVDFKKN